MNGTLEVVLVATQRHLKAYPRRKESQQDLEEGAWKFIPQEMKANRAYVK